MKAEVRNTAWIAHLVRRSLLAGLVASSLLLIVGLLIVLITGQQRPETVPPDLRSLLNRILRGDGVATLDLGLLILMLTPLARLVMLTIGWSLTKERLFALITLGVLGLLCMSLTLGVL